MRRLLGGMLLVMTATIGMAQPFTFPENYAPTATPGGTIQETTFGSDVTTFNPAIISSATDRAIIGMMMGPTTVYRDWLGNRSYRKEDGSFNLFWASNIEEVVLEQEYIVTLKEGWKWSDGTEMTADDVEASFKIFGDAEVEAGAYACSVVDEQPVEFEKLGTYQYRFRLPQPQVNAIINNDCANFGGLLPAHIFMPVYEAEGAAGIKALWGVDTPVDQLVSGGPYKIVEYRPGERLTFEKNPLFGEFIKAADGTPLPGPDTWTVTPTEDRNAELALCSTGQCSFYWPTTLDEVSAIQQAVDNGTIPGQFYPDIGPSTSIDFMFYNFNSTDTCKSEMFRNTTFRQAINLMIDRQALVDAAVGGLGFPAKDAQTDAAAPFNAPDLPEFEFNPDRGVELLNSIGFTELGDDGVLVNPDTGCRVEFDIQSNAGNTRRSQLSLVMSQTAAEYGVKINPKEVSVEVWQDSWGGNSLPRAHDFDAQIGGIAGGDIDSPASTETWLIGADLNGWNKSKADAQPWEILMERTTVAMKGELDLEKRIALYNERAQIIRDELPITPLIARSFHFYHNVGNVFPLDKMDAKSIESPYFPGNDRSVLTTQ
ncbi:MAG: ABC transporter substrate-binding protein [Trueperaceae bacterium]